MRFLELPFHVPASRYVTETRTQPTTAPLPARIGDALVVDGYVPAIWISGSCALQLRRVFQSEEPLRSGRRKIDIVTDASDLALSNLDVMARFGDPVGAAERIAADRASYKATQGKPVVQSRPDLPYLLERIT